jgi:hypothetical protein
LRNSRINLSKRFTAIRQVDKKITLRIFRSFVMKSEK